MNSRERFRETMGYGRPDRPPYFEQRIRNQVLRLWRRQGMPLRKSLSRIFPSDRLEELEPDLGPLPQPGAWPSSSRELDTFRQLLDADDPARLPGSWARQVRRWRNRDHLLLLTVHHGLFLTLGVHGWNRFSEAIHLLSSDPAFVRRAMTMQSEFAAQVTDKILREVEIDAAIFSEPICDNHGPLISPRMYEDFVLGSLRPLLEVLERHGVQTLVFMTYANARLFLPVVLKHGFNCLWAYEVNIDAMDYRALRREFGRDLLLIGGIDLDALRRGKEAIRREILEKVPPLLQDGGYVPVADGRIRSDVPYENYVYYRRLLEEVARGG